MKRHLCLAGLTLAIVATCALQVDTQDEYIPHRVERAIGGQSFERGRWPWLVLLRATIVTERLLGLFPIRHYHLYCGGALINDRWLLTAAHCFTGNGNQASRPRNWEARLAAVRLRATNNSTSPCTNVSLQPSISQRLLDVIGRVLDQNELRQWEIDVERIVPHPAHNTTSLLNDDIALVKLSRPVPNNRRFSLIRSIPLPDINDTNFPETGQVCVTKGWGCTAQGGGPSDEAQQIAIPVYPPRQCSLNYNLASQSMDKRICAGHSNRGVGVCSGDSGSPLVCQKDNQYILAGIVSFTSRNRPESFPAVFTRVQDYIPWINSVLQAYS